MDDEMSLESALEDWLDAAAKYLNTRDSVTEVVWRNEHGPGIWNPVGRVDFTQTISIHRIGLTALPESKNVPRTITDNSALSDAFLTGGQANINRSTEDLIEILFSRLLQPLASEFFRRAFGGKRSGEDVLQALYDQIHQVIQDPDSCTVVWQSFYVNAELDAKPIYLDTVDALLRAVTEDEYFYIVDKTQGSAPGFVNPFFGNPLGVVLETRRELRSLPVDFPNWGIYPFHSVA